MLSLKLAPALKAPGIYTYFHPRGGFNLKRLLCNDPLVWPHCRYRLSQVLAELTTTIKIAQCIKHFQHATRLSYPVNAKISLMFSSQRALTISKKAVLTFISRSSIATFASTFIPSTFFSQSNAQAFAQTQTISTSFSLSQLRQQSNSHANCWATRNDHASRASSCSGYSGLNVKFANESKRERKRTCNETGQTIATWHNSLNKIRTCLLPCKTFASSATYFLNFVHKFIPL